MNRKTWMLRGCLVFGLVAATVWAEDKKEPAGSEPGGKKVEKMMQMRQQREDMRRRMIGMDGAQALWLFDNPRIMKELNLLPEQQATIKKIRDEHKAQMDTLNPQLEQAAMEQLKLIEQESADQAAVLQAVDNCSRIRGEISRQRTKYLLQIRAVLTPEQRAKVKELVKSKGGQRGKMMDRPQHPVDGAAKGPAPAQNPPPTPGVEKKEAVEDVKK